MKQRFNISDMQDVSFPSGQQYANIHLFTGDIVQISKDVIDRMHSTLQPLQVTMKETARVHDCAMYEPIWPNGTLDAPVWKTADNRILPVTEMSDYHIANAQRIVANIIRQWPNTKNIEHYRQWREWFSLETRRRKAL